MRSYSQLKWTHGYTHIYAREETGDPPPTLAPAPVSGNSPTKSDMSTSSSSSSSMFDVRYEWQRVQCLQYLSIYGQTFAVNGYQRAHRLRDDRTRTANFHNVEHGFTDNCTAPDGTDVASSTTGGSTIHTLHVPKRMTQKTVASPPLRSSSVFFSDRRERATPEIAPGVRRARPRWNSCTLPPPQTGGLEASAMLPSCSLVCFPWWLTILLVHRPPKVMHCSSLPILSLELAIVKSETTVSSSGYSIQNQRSVATA